MPWTPKTFAKRHNKKLKGRRAAKASKVANAVLKRTGDEGMAIRVANARAGRGLLQS